MNAELRSLVLIAGLAALPARGGAARMNLGSGLEERARPIAAWFQDNAPFLVSPDGRELLVKLELGAGRSELRLSELGTGRFLGAYRGEWPLLIAWRPRSRWLSFVEDTGGDFHFRLKFWNLSDGRVSLPPVPELGLADRFMRWSPDGRFLALPTPGPGGEDELRIVPAANPGASTVIFRTKAIADFDWSPDGDRLALAAGGLGGDVLILDRTGGGRRRIPVRAGADLKKIGWLRGEDGLLVTAREPGMDWYVLKRLDLRSGATRTVAAGDGDIDLPPRAILRDGRCVFHLIHGGLSRLCLAGGPSGPRPLGFKDGSTSFLALDEDDGCVFAAHRGLTEPSGLYRIPLGPGEPALVYRRSRANDLRGVAPVRLEISAADGARFPIYLWRSRAPVVRGVVIAPPIIRRDPMDITFDGGNQYIIAQGCDYLMFDFRPSSYQGPDSDTRISEGDLADGAAAIDYAHRTLGLPWSRIALYGQSNGATFVARLLPRLAGKPLKILFRGLTTAMAQAPAVPDGDFTIALLQGENDPFSPTMAKTALERLYGPAALDGNRGFFRILRGEGHRPRFIASRSLVAAAALELLFPPP